MKKIEREINTWTDRLTKKEADWLAKELRTTSPRKTGNYARKWKKVKVARGVWSIQNNHPAAMRLEYGFIGVDSMGRHYSQSPQPHVLPAVEKFNRRFRDEIPEELQKELDRIDSRS